MKPFTHIIIVEFEVKLYFKNEYGYEEDTMIDFIVDDGRKNISKEIEKLKDKIRDSYTEILDTKVYSAYIDNVLEDYLIEHYETQDEKRKLDIEKISSMELKELKNCVEKYCPYIEVKNLNEYQLANILLDNLKNINNNNKKVKTIDFIDLNNETLKKIIDFDVFDADKIIINYKDINDESVDNKITELLKTLNKFNEIYNMKHWDKNVVDLISTEEDKYWIEYEIDENGEMKSVSCETETILNIIQFLYDYDYINDFILEKLYKAYIFRKQFGGGQSYLNFNLEIVENKL